MVDLTPLQSSNLQAAGHDPAALELHVLFQSGDLWVYQGVPQEVFGGLLTAESKGAYFAQFVKKNFRGERRETVVGLFGTAYDLHVACQGCGSWLTPVRSTGRQVPDAIQCQTPGCRHHAKKFKPISRRVELEVAD